LVALDARVVVHPPEMTEEQLPKLAIRPYPVRYAAPYTTKDGLELSIRPIRPEDEPLMVKFHEQLSERTVYLRYLQMVNLNQRVAHERLQRICFIDYDREIALVATKSPEGKDAEKREEIIAVGRLKKIPGTREAEFAVLVTDQYQRHGLGSELLRRLLDVARAEGIEKISADILSDNMAMQKVCERMGFRLERSLDDPVVKAQLDLAPATV
jgi:acetyltransferase